jgi:hypothetical protein
MGGDPKSNWKPYKKFNRDGGAGKQTKKGGGRN